MKFLYSFILLFAGLLPAFGQKDLNTRFEKSNGTETVTYQEGIAYFKQLADLSEFIEIREMGLTDSGEPLHLLIFDTDKEFDFEKSKAKNKTILLINNAIHPGEPDGVDASMLLLRELIRNKKARRKLDNTVLAVIPFYNIGGALNRNSTTRANQNGPVAYGFRGNARNYDLNRDFIKNDTRNARSFVEIYQMTDPDLYVETHVSNGADYQYIMTLLATQPNKLGGVLGQYLKEDMLPELYEKMEEKKFPMTPYVNVWGTVPDSGYVEFVDYPRYSSGYTTLFGTLGFITETHMLKPYKQRVESTYAFLESMIEFADEHGEQVQELKKQQQQNMADQQKFPLDWEVDKSRHDVLSFKGYEGQYIESKVSGQQRLFYDRSKPFEKDIKYFNHFKGVNFVEKPQAYIIPQGWHSVIDRLKENGVEMKRLEQDSTLEVEVYHMANWETRKYPYEGHFMHSKVEVTASMQKIQLRKGDYLIPMGKKTDRFVVETLEPEAADSYFRWNFFDTILQQKEHFSPYVFEDVAAEMLAKDPELKAKLEQKRKEDPEFAKNGYAQLNFIYEHSPHYEKAYLRYPVFRVKQQLN